MQQLLLREPQTNVNETGQGQHRSELWGGCSEMQIAQLTRTLQARRQVLRPSADCAWQSHLPSCELVTRMQFAAITIQQAPSLQIHPQTHLDLRHPNLGHSIHIQHRDTRTLSIIGPWHNRRRTVVCAEKSHLSRPPNDFRQRRNLSLKQPILHSSDHTSKWPNINPHGDSRQQEFAKIRGKRSA
jgi:hypothetical protein